MTPNTFTSSNTSLWYVAETLPRAEMQARQHLDRQGFANFCPRFHKTRRHARRVEQVLAPLFPGYIFVRFDPDRDHWLSINGTRGIRRLVGQSTARPTAMPEDVMAALFERCDDDIVHRILPTLTPGQPVRLLSGPFADRLATIEHLDDRGRASVLLEILGAARSVRVTTRELAPV